MLVPSSGHEGRAGHRGDGLALYTDPGRGRKPRTKKAPAKVTHSVWWDLMRAFEKISKCPQCDALRTFFYIFQIITQSECYSNRAFHQ
jgi:hypothetical protein